MVTPVRVRVVVEKRWCADALEQMLGHQLPDGADLRDAFVDPTTGRLELTLYANADAAAAHLAERPGTLTVTYFPGAHG